MNEYILVSSGGRSFRLRKDEIIRIESCNDHPVIFMACGKQYVYSRHLKVLEEQLNSQVFYRVHKSYVINLNRIEDINWRESVVTMIDHAIVPISQRNKAELRRMLK